MHQNLHLDIWSGDMTEHNDNYAPLRFEDLSFKPSKFLDPISNEPTQSWFHYDHAMASNYIAITQNLIALLLIEAKITALSSSTLFFDSK